MDICIHVHVQRDEIFELLRPQLRSTKVTALLSCLDLILQTGAFCDLFGAVNFQIFVLLGGNFAI